MPIPAPLLSLASEFRRVFGAPLPQHPPARSGRWTGAGTIVRRRLGSIRWRARFDKSNTRGAMLNVPYERERVRKTERATRSERT
jgi:hypothetical protein